jgi:hypothetical protein
MAIVTGKNCTIKIGTKAYEGVVNNYELAFETTATEYQTLDGPLAGPGSETGTLTIVWAYDSGETNSLFDDIWTAADAGTPVAYEAKVGRSKFTGNAVAARPNVPADAEGVSECTVELALDGIPTKAAATP